MNWSARERGSWRKGWIPTWPRSPLVGDPVRAMHSLRSGGALRAPKTVPREGHPRNLYHDVKGTSFVLPDTQRHAEFEMALRGCSVDANDDYSRVCTATRSDCSFLCVFIRQVARLTKQSNSSQRSCRPNVPHIQVLVLHSQLGISFRAHVIDISFNGQTHPERNRLCRLGIEQNAIENPFRNVKKLCHLFSRLKFLSRHKSKGRSMVLRPLSDIRNQLEVHFLVHILQLPLQVQRHGVSSSPIRTMFASAPSKFPPVYKSNIAPV